MIIATVKRPIWATKRLEGLPSGALLEIEVNSTGERMVAFDVLGSGLDEVVLVSQGSVVSNKLPGNPPVDAMIVGVIDHPSN